MRLTGDRMVNMPNLHSAQSTNKFFECFFANLHWNEFIFKSFCWLPLIKVTLVLWSGWGSVPIGYWTLPILHSSWPAKYIAVSSTLYPWGTLVLINLQLAVSKGTEKLFNRRPCEIIILSIWHLWGHFCLLTFLPLFIFRPSTQTWFS